MLQRKLNTLRVGGIGDKKKPEGWAGKDPVCAGCIAVLVAPRDTR